MNPVAQLVELRGEPASFAPSRGIEPLSRDPESRVLSVELRGQREISKNFVNDAAKKQ